MLIDWFTVGAQTLNFLVLVGLMHRLLYRPILRAIDAREKRIAEGFAEADLKKVAAEKERADFQSRNEALERQRAALVSQMAEEVSAERSRLLDAARREAEALSAKRMESLRDEATHLNQALGRRAQQEVFAIARKTLADLASASLEERMAEVFVSRLRALGEQEKAELRAAFLAGAGAPAVVRSAFDLDAALRSQIDSAVKEAVAPEAATRFEVAPDFVSGIELAVTGLKLAWNIDAYLLSLEKGVSELLTLDGQPKGQAFPRTDETGTVNA